MEKTLPVGSVILYAWTEVKKHLGFFILLTLILFAAVGIPRGISAYLEEDFLVTSLAFDLISTFMSIWLGAGIFFISLKIYNQQEVQISDLFSQIKVFWKYFWASVLVGILTAIGFILLIPGIILALMYQMTNFYIVEKNMGSLEAMKASKQATNGLKWNLLGLALALIGINILGLIPFGLGLLVTIPLTWMALVKAYKLADSQV